MVRIAFIHNNFPSGGAERISMDIARQLKNMGGRYEAFVYTSRLNSGMLPEDIGDFLTVRTISTDAVPFRKEADIRRLVRNDKIDILVQVVKRVKGIKRIRKSTGCRVVFANHGVPFWEEHAIIYRRQNGPLKRILWKAFNRKRFVEKGAAHRMAVRRSWKNYRNCDAYTVLCGSYKRHICREFGIEPDKSHIFSIYNPEVSVSDVCFEKEKMILFCGRLSAQKRISRLLKIWSRVQDRLPDWRLVIVGDGPDRTMAEDMIRELGLERISMEGWRNDSGEYYRKASILCLVSQYEGWPLALTEAQANGVIPIAFDCCDGVTEILSPEGVHGFAVRSFDEDAFAETLVRVAEMPEEEKLEIRRNTVKRIMDFSPENIAGAWAELFDRLYNDKK